MCQLGKQILRMGASDDKVGSTCRFVKLKDEHDVHKANRALHYFESVLPPAHRKSRVFILEH